METPRLRTPMLLVLAVTGLLVALLAEGSTLRERVGPPRRKPGAIRAPARVAPPVTPTERANPKSTETDSGRRRVKPPSSEPREVETVSLSPERERKLNASLDSYAKMLKIQWGFSQLGGNPGYEFKHAKAPERAWLREQLLRLPFGHARLPAVLWAMSLQLDGGADSQLSHLAAFVLGDDAHARSRAIDVLAEGLYDVNDGVAELYAAILRVATDGSAAEQVPALLALSGLRALDLSTGLHVKDIHALADLQAAYESGSGAVRAAALRGLERLDDIAPHRKLHSLRLSGRGHHAVPFLARALADERHVVQVAGLEILRDEPSELITTHEDAIVTLLGSSEDTVRNAAIDTLPRADTISVNAARALVGLLADDYPDVANNAMWALAQSGRGTMVPLARLTRGLTAARQALPAPNLICIGQHGRNGAAAAEALVSTIRHGGPFEAEHAILALHAVAPGHEPAFDVLVSCVPRAYQPTRGAAAVALGAFGERAVPHLTKLAGDDIDTIRNAAARALTQAAPTPHEEPAIWDAMDWATGRTLVALARSVADAAPDDARLLDALERIREDPAARQLAEKAGLDVGEESE